MSKAKRTGKIFLDYLRNDQFSTAVGSSIAPRPAERTGLHACDLAAGEARSGSRGIYDTYRASASEEVEGMGRLLRGRAISTGGDCAAPKARGPAAGGLTGFGKRKTRGEEFQSRASAAGSQPWE
jgi:hypothetical protein